TIATTEMTALCRVQLITPPAAPGPPGAGARPHLLQSQPAARPANRLRSKDPLRPAIGPWHGQRRLSTLSGACDDADNASGPGTGKAGRGPGRWQRPGGTAEEKCVDEAIQPGSVRLMAAAALGQLFTSLHDAGFSVIGPTVRDGAIVLDELQTAGDLPFG